jgi:ketosteroid isomerase-like protein
MSEKSQQEQVDMTEHSALGAKAPEPKEIVRKLLGSIQNPDVVRAMCSPDVTYVSLNYSNPDLHKIMPWCGTGHGVNAISKTFHDVARYWNVDSFTPEVVFGEEGNVAVFGRFTYTSTKLRKTVTTPFSIYCSVRDGKVVYMQFMEDTFCTAYSFRSGGKWQFESDPDGGQVEI